MEERITNYLATSDETDRYSYLTLDCTVTILEGPQLPELSRRLFTVMQSGLDRPEGTLFWEGTLRTGDEFLQIMADEQRLIYEFEVTGSYGMF